MYIKAEIKTTGDGSQTVLHPVYGDSYHSLNGAVAESMHVFVGNGFRAHPKPDVAILEVGFGTGLNSLLTLRESLATGRRVHYTAVELYPLDPVSLNETEYSRQPYFTVLHESPWGIDRVIAGNFTLHKIHEDLAVTVFNRTFDIVYFDAFSPDTQPEMWTTGIFVKIFDSLAPGGILVTYSSKGDVKRALREAGFEVNRLTGAPGKRHMVRAVKPRKIEHL